ncbi:hypothetical protein [Pseudomonas knackmussii]|uniref:Secreted protein n=1 Tax=Pseudomonas knackmussii TaxID=65741 RepID=A0ABY4KWK7_9PSED|nr:hypothetical protein [Pseudomonas knackmussii]UPQ83933.1 hypothetical protein M0M42_05875 [Pseudomonas knackmussii]
MRLARNGVGHFQFPHFDIQPLLSGYGLEAVYTLFVRIEGGAAHCTPNSGTSSNLLSVTTGSGDNTAYHDCTDCSSSATGEFPRAFT